MDIIVHNRNMKYSCMYVVACETYELLYCWLGAVIYKINVPNMKHSCITSWPKT